MTIYLDIVFIENIVMNYIILLATKIILKAKAGNTRLIISSLIGAIYTVMAYITTIEIYSNFFVKIILSIMIIYIAFYPPNVKTMLKQLAIFYLTSFAFGGAAFALIYIIKPQEILMKNGLFLGTYPLKTVVLSTIIAFILIIVSFKIVKTKISKKDIYKDVKIVLNNKEITLKTMLDTGNLLKEPITGMPVIVVEHTALYNIIPKEILNNLKQILAGDFTKIPEETKNKYVTKLKYIPFSSLGKQNGMLLGIKAQYIQIFEEEENKKLENIIIGIYDKSFTKDGKYRALMGINL